MSPLSSILDRLATPIRALYDRFTRPRVKSAGIYAGGGKFYICAMSETVEWLWISTPPFLSGETDNTSDAELGKLVRQALDASRQGLRHPPVEELERLSEPLARLAGVKSFRTFEKSAICLEINEQEGVVTLTPTRNAGKDGFVEMTERETKLAADAGPAELGSAIRDGLKRCE